MSSDLSRILEPESVAIIGASRDETKRGHQVIETLLEWDYDGEIYPVNPKYDGEILGLDVYPTVMDIPSPVDLAFVATPAQIVTSVLEDCGEADVAGAVIIAAGFSEAGAEELEREMVATAHEHGVRIIGPNINGIINVQERLDLVGMEEIPHGHLALLSQSGNVFLSLVNEAIRRTAVEFSYYIALGNEADLRVHEYLSFFSTHDPTDCIVIFAEGMADGRSFLQTAAKVTSEKPVVVLKGGRSAAGKRSASSHTASLAGDAAVLDDVYRQAGVVSIDRSDEVLSVAETLTKLPPAHGRGVGILSDGGGHATLCADAVSANGLDVPTLQSETQERLLDRAPRAANVANPVDLLTLEDDLDRVYDYARAMLADPGIDALLVLGMFGGYGSRFTEEYARRELDTAEKLAELPAEYNTPVVVHSAYAGLESDALDVLRRRNVPVFESLDVAVTCVDALCSYGEHLATSDRKSDFRLEPTEKACTVPDVASAEGTLSEYESLRLLEAFDVPVVPFELAETADEAVAAADDTEGAVAMKIASPDIVHKTEANGVRLDVEGAASVRDAFHSLVASATEYDPETRIDGVLVMPMRDATIEIIVGTVDDDEVGQVLAFGLGGVLVETLQDVAFRALPLTQHDAEQLVDEPETSTLLDGVRGGPAVDREAIVDLVCRISDLVETIPTVAELDLNPVFATPEGVEVVDATITLDSERG